MATWTSISNAAVAVGGIPSSSTVTALRDNPVAIAGAASGAPVVFAGWHPYDKVTIGDGKDGLIYNHAVNGTVADVVTPDFEDGFEYRLIGTGLSHDSGSNRNLILEVFRETTASYVQAYITATAASGSTTLATFAIDAELTLPRLARNPFFIRVMATSPSLDANTNGVASVGSTLQKLLRARLLFSAGNIDAGKVWMFRRREYASLP
jgi:predicted heme/steroid binding protein